MSFEHNLVSRTSCCVSFYAIKAIITILIITMSPKEQTTHQTSSLYEALNLGGMVSSSSFDNSSESGLIFPNIPSSSNDWNNPSLWMTRSPILSELFASPRSSRSERMQFLTDLFDEVIQLNEEFLSSDDFGSCRNSSSPPRTQ
jgi:hypothetical protein